MDMCNQLLDKDRISLERRYRKNGESIMQIEFRPIEYGKDYDLVPYEIRINMLLHLSMEQKIEVKYIDM